ncbi:glycosyltransferase family 2 protein [Soonwooa purpurea]
MRLAIVILNWNGKSWLEKFLPNIIQYSGNAEVYVIDNASSDDSVIWLNKNYPQIKQVFNKTNLGFAQGYNEGLKEICADIYCLLNSDVEVTPNWTKPIMTLFSENSEIAAIQPKILDFNNKKKFEFAGAGGGLIDNLGYPYCRGREFETIEEDKGQYNDITEIFWASGCALFIRAKDFWNEKGFDERFFAHQEEIDLCWRLKNNNRKIYYCGQSTVYHVGGGTLNKQNPQKTYLNFRNNLSMMLKNLPSNKLYLIFFRLSLDGIAGIYMMFKDGFSHTWAIVRSHVGFYAEFVGTLKRRQKHQIKDYYQTKWLIFKHFLK